MGPYTQGAGSPASLRAQDHINADHKKASANGGAEGRHISRFSAEALINSRPGPKIHHRAKRSGRVANRSGPRIGVVAFLVLSIVSVTIFGGDYLFSLIRSRTGFWESDSKDFSDNKKEKTLHFGRAHVKNEELLDRDSRYWDRDDRIRDLDIDYEEANSKDINGQQYQRETLPKDDQERLTNLKRGEKLSDFNDPDTRTPNFWRQSPSGNGGLYNERGRKELRIYAEQLEASSKEELNSSENDAAGFYDKDTQKDAHRHFDDRDSFLNTNTNLPNATEEVRRENLFLGVGDDDYYSDFLSEVDHSELMNDEDPGMEYVEEDPSDSDPDARGVDFSLVSEVMPKNLSEVSVQKGFPGGYKGESTQPPNRKSKHRRHSGLPCEIDFLQSTEGIKEPEASSGFHNFSLRYVELEHPQAMEGWKPRFAGHQSLAQRNQSFKAVDQTVHCGFVQAVDRLKKTGFDLAEDDVQYLGTCRIAVSSCIFGSSDNVRAPRNRKLTGSFKKDVCFVMFVDQSTLDVMQKEGQQLDEKGYVGPWKIVLVKNMPYADARRVGKIPKFLTHRLFPAARYSIWLDSKLRLQIDPVLILEYFLWRGGFEYAISNHYDRHCVWEEVLQNKKLNKYNHTAIDKQFAYYRADGLTRFNASDRRKLLPSNVPEGSFIIRAHTPMSNLFSCLWFNEVDRFTSRDQLSFAYTYMKFVRANPTKHFYFNMFKDCERKSITKLFRHRKINPSIFDSHP